MWMFEEGSGNTANDSSGHGAHGTLNGPTWSQGKTGGGLSFDGINDYVRVPRNSSLEPANAITIALWAKMSNSNGGDYVDLVRKALPYNIGYLLRWSYRDARLQLRIDRSSQPGIVVADTQSNTAYLNQWHHFAATYDSATGSARLYVDGLLRNSTSHSGGIDHADDLYLMHVGYPEQSPGTGQLDDVRIYGRALTAAQIQALANLQPEGISDLNGNSLDGEFSGTFPSGNGIAGGNFIAEFRIQPGPVAQPVVTSTNEDTAAIGAFNASGAAGTTLTYHVVTPPAAGSVTLVPDTSTFIYTPAANATGVATFTYKANDGTFDSDVASVTIAINAQNDAPTIVSAAQAVPQAPQVGQNVSFSGFASDVDGDTLTYSWTFGDGSQASGASAAHAYAAAGVYTATLTVSDGNGGSVTSSVVVNVQNGGNPTGNRPPAITIIASAAPSNPRVNQAVTFSVSASDPDGDVLTYIWSFGDATQGQGATTAHTYTAAGNYIASVTVSDGRGGTVTGSVNVTVLTLAGAKPGDSDGDGISDEVEIGAGTDPLDPNSPVTVAMTVSKVSGSMNFTKENADACSLSGILTGVPAGFSPEGMAIVFDIGGAAAVFTLDAKGKGVNELGQVMLKVKGKRDKKTKKIVFAGGDVPFSLKMKGGTWSDEWGVSPGEDVTKEPMEFSVNVLLGGTVYEATLSPKLTAKAGKGGKFK